MSDEFARKVLGEDAVRAARGSGAKGSGGSGAKGSGGSGAKDSGGSGAKGKMSGKKMGIIAAGVIAVVVIVICAILFWPKKSKVTNASCLEGLDVLCAPMGITMQGDSFLVTDSYGKKIWKVTGGHAIVYAGTDTVEDLYGQPMGGYNDAEPSESLFKEPWAIVPFLNGYAVSDTKNHAVRLVTDTMVQTVNGRSANLEEGDLGVTFDMPTGLAVDDTGSLYVADTARGTIYKITKDGRVDVYQEGLNSPMGICWYNGALYVAETGEHRIIFLQGGKITVVAGTGDEGDDDGPAAKATFSSPTGVAVGKDGTVYVGDTVNGSVRRIKNGMVETIMTPQDHILATNPVSPTGLYCVNDALYVCDPFARMVYIIAE